MSNAVPPHFRPGSIPTAGEGQRIGDVTLYQITTDMPNGKAAAQALRIGDNFGGDPAMRESRQIEHLTHTNPAALTEGLEKDIARMEQQWEDISGYDREGQPLYRVTGREREVLEMKLANRRSALRLAWQERQRVEAFQRQRKAEAEAADARINAAAAARAVELAEEAEIERRAKLIAMRAVNKR